METLHYRQRQINIGVTMLEFFVACLDDDNGISGEAYVKLLDTLAAFSFPQEVIDVFATQVDATDGRFYLRPGAQPVALYKQIMS